MKCISCNYSTKDLIDFGNHYKCSDFFKKSIEKKSFKRKNLSIIICKECNLLQLKKPIFYKDITPKFKWMKNKEEDNYHFDYIKLLLKKKKLKKNLKILGMSVYDTTLLTYLKFFGYKNSKLFNINNDLRIKNKNAEKQEVIQNFLNKKNAELFSKKNGKYDLIVCSKLLEHSQNIKKVLDFLNIVLHDKGYLIIDVPDSTKSLSQGNISMIWEEHISYFTANTLKNVAYQNGFKVILQKRYPFKQEDNLIYLMEKKRSNSLTKLKDYTKPMVFKKQIYLHLIKLKKILKDLKDRQFKVAIYGGGHNSVAFINLYNIGQYIDCIVDDDKRKSNLFSIESNLPVKKLKDLNKKFKFAFFLGTSISSEEKIKKKLKEIKKSKIFSIFPDSKLFYNK